MLGGRDEYRYWHSASRLTVFAHLFGILGIILMIVWLLHYRGGIEYGSDDANRVFNVHPFLMYCGLIFLSGQAMMAYKTVKSERKVQKTIHMILHFSSVIFGIVGICAAFKFHDMRKIDDMNSLHSWIGIGVICLYCLQWVFGLVVYFFPGAPNETRIWMMPWHICGGRALFYVAVAAALTGMMEQSSYIQGLTESRLANFIGISILLYGVFVDLSVALARYV